MSSRLIGASHSEKIRKKNKRKEEIQNRVIQRISFKEKMKKHQQEMLMLRQKRLKYEDRHMGNYKRSYPNDLETKQKLYDKYLQTFKIPGGGAINRISQSISKKEENRKNSYSQPKYELEVIKDKIIHTAGNFIILALYRTRWRGKSRY